PETIFTAGEVEARDQDRPDAALAIEDRECDVERRTVGDPPDDKVTHGEVSRLDGLTKVRTIGHTHRRGRWRRVTDDGAVRRSHAEHGVGRPTLLQAALQ